MKIKTQVKNLASLENELLFLDADIAKSDALIKAGTGELLSLDIPDFINGIAVSDVERKAAIVRDPGGKLFPQLAAGLTGRLLPRKLGFFKKMAIKTAVILGVRKWLKNKGSFFPETGTERGVRPVQPAEKPHKSLQTAKSNIVDNPPATSKVSDDEQKLSGFKKVVSILKSAIAGFSEHKVTKLSGSLAYYTVFSMAPLLVVIISLSGIFFGREAAEGQVFTQLKGLLGSDTAAQLQELIRHAAVNDKGNIAFIIGIITLVMGATSIFADIQDSINYIWGIKPKPKRGWLKMIQNRFLSLSVIVSLGFLLVVSLSVSALLDGFNERLQARFSDISVIVFYVLNLIVTLGVITLIFGVIFKVLPDASIKWRQVIWGAVVTALLFMAGKFGISLYISQSNVGSTYGAAGSLVVLLLWTYYSSIILYFGAEFTKAFALSGGAQIMPNHYAVTVQEVEVEKGRSAVEQNS